jgi:hypothetical protein
MGADYYISMEATIPVTVEKFSPLSGTFQVPVTVDLLRTWAAANRHRDSTLTVDKHLCPQHNNYVMDTYKFLGAEPWTMYSLDPPGLLSFYLWSTDPLYAAGGKQLRSQILNEGYISMRAAFEVAAPGRKRRRMVELFENGLGVNRDGLAVEKPDLEAYWTTWATVMNCQFVRIGSREEKRISFTPALSAWSAQKPVYYLDEGCETIFVAPGVSGRRTLAAWICEREADGWTVIWPVAEGTKEEMERRLMPLLNVVRVSEKAKKAEIAGILGRHDGLESLMRFSAGEELL